MRYRMTLDNSRIGRRYIITLEEDKGKWQALRYISFSQENDQHLLGTAVVATTAYDAFVKVKELIEDADADIFDVDWQFEEPLPPWLLE